jgi:large subunit ribosomal protein L23
VNLYNVLVRPVLSEKSNSAREAGGKYTFEVNLKSTKEDVQRAVEKIYNVKVSKVQTMVTRGKVRRRGLHVSLDRKCKKAVVTLAAGAKLPLFEDQ